MTHFLSSDEQQAWERKANEKKKVSREGGEGANPGEAVTIDNGKCGRWPRF
jgi:hypothetical protein